MRPQHHTRTRMPLFPLGVRLLLLGAAAWAVVALVVMGLGRILYLLFALFGVFS